MSSRQKDEGMPGLMIGGALFFVLFLLIGRDWDEPCMYWSILISSGIAFVIGLVSVIQAHRKRPWEHSDPAIRRAAVERILASESMHELEDAIDYINEEDLLIRIAMTARIPKKESHPYRTPSRGVLLRTEGSGAELQAWMDRSEHVRTRAVKKIRDQKVLFKIAAEWAGHDEPCIQAVKQIEDQSILEAIAKSLNIVASVRAVAVEKVEDQNVLADIILDPKACPQAGGFDIPLAEALIEHLNDEAPLERVALGLAKLGEYGGPLPIVFRGIVGKVAKNNRSLIARLAKDTENHAFREAAEEVLG